MNWALIIIIFYTVGDAPAVTSVPFKTATLCENAAVKVNKRDSLGRSVDAFCVRTSNEP